MNFARPFGAKSRFGLSLLTLGLAAVLNVAPATAQLSQTQINAPRPGGSFGAELAIVNGTGVIGSAGAVRIYNGATEVQTIVAPTPSATDNIPDVIDPVREEVFKGFGSRVAFDGITLVTTATSRVAGLPGEIDFASRPTEVVFVYQRDENGVFVEVSRFVAQRLGALSVSGNEILIGGSTPLIYDLNGNVQAALTLVVPSRFEDFGADVAISGDVAVVGAPNADVNGVIDAGSVSLFLRGADGIWRFFTALTAPRPTGRAQFGQSVALDGNRLVVAAEKNNTNDDGSAFVFERPSFDGFVSPIFRLTQTLNARSRSNFSAVRASVAVSGDRILLGTPVLNLTTFQRGNGQVAQFNLVNESWQRVAQFDANGDNGSYEFGSSVALSGDEALIGAPSAGGGVGTAFFVTLQ